ncbi:MAG: glycosyltransferase family 2 protein [Candidatus Omnitrophota bacterium]|jgi:glycosyltransferase involved in cell wall biosynthesis
MYKYILITPVRDEETFIEKTIKSVIGQTVLPVRWVIVSDGSTDHTDDIVKKYLKEYPWIELMRMPERARRHFAGKAHAFNAGYERVRNLEYDIIGNLDADTSFDPEYFSFLLKKFESDPKLGVGGTPFIENGVQYDYRFSRKEHVSGQCQLFRRECFESIGGYIPLEKGSIDLVAVVTARMKGWKTETFTDKTYIHNRLMGSAYSHPIKSAFRMGYLNYIMGSHPVWQLLRSIYQMGRKPFILKGSMFLAGYFWAMLIRAKMPVSREFVRFRRKEQMRWLKEYFIRSLP